MIDAFTDPVFPQFGEGDLKSIVRYLPITFLVLILDQLSKYWAYTELRFRPDINIISGLMKFSYAENPGIAFGIFAESDSRLKVVALALISLIAIGMVIYFSLKAANNKMALIALMLVLGGIIGNLVDRVHLSIVIDFIEVYYRSYHWPTFNIADAAICIGAALLSIDILREPKAEQAEDQLKVKEGSEV